MIRLLAMAVAPSVGPALVTIAGLDVPILALTISAAALLLARGIAPAPTRKLTKMQDWALTGLLMIILALIVSGRFGGGHMGEGMATMWGIGLGFSGLIIIDVIGERIVTALKVLLGQGNDHG